MTAVSFTERAAARPAPAATAATGPAERRETGREHHQRERRRVRDHLEREQVERRRDGQEGRSQQSAGGAAEPATDQPAADRAQGDHDEQSRSQVDDADSRDVRQPAQEIVEAGELGREDVRAERLPMPQCVERGEIDVLVVVRRAVNRPGEQQLCATSTAASSAPSSHRARVNGAGGAQRSRSMRPSVLSAAVIVLLESASGLRSALSSGRMLRTRRSRSLLARIAAAADRTRPTSSRP